MKTQKTGYPYETLAQAGKRVGTVRCSQSLKNMILSLRKMPPCLYNQYVGKIGAAIVKKLNLTCFEAVSYIRYAKL